MPDELTQLVKNKLMEISMMGIMTDYTPAAEQLIKEVLAKARPDREKIAEIFYGWEHDCNGYYGYKWEDVPNDWRGKVNAYKRADQILALQGEPSRTLFEEEK